MDDDDETTYETTTFPCFNFKIHIHIHIHALIMVDQYMRLMGDKTIPDFVAGIDLPHQGVVDSYNSMWTTKFKSARRFSGV